MTATFAGKQGRSGSDFIDPTGQSDRETAATEEIPVLIRLPDVSDPVEATQTRAATETPAAERHLEFQEATNPAVGSAPANAETEASGGGVSSSVMAEVQPPEDVGYQTSLQWETASERSSPQFGLRMVAAFALMFVVVAAYYYAISSGPAEDDGLKDSDFSALASSEEPETVDIDAALDSLDIRVNPLTEKQGPTFTSPIADYNTPNTDAEPESSPQQSLTLQPPALETDMSLPMAELSGPSWDESTATAEHADRALTLDEAGTAGDETVRDTLSSNAGAAADVVQGLTSTQDGYPATAKAFQSVVTSTYRYPVTNPRTFQYPAKYHEYLQQSRANGGSSGTGQESMNANAWEQSTARLQPRIDAPPIR